MIEHVDPQPGQTVLEVAAGPGETGFLAAERVGPSGRVLSTDFAPSMVAAARRGAAARGLDNVECLVMDAQQLDLPDGSVDVVISRLGLMLVPDPRAALAETRRVLRPGGRLAYAVMGPPDRNPWVALITLALAQAGRPPIVGNPFELGGVFGLSSPDVNAALLAEAGYQDVEVGELPGSIHFDSVEDYWTHQCAIAGPARVALDSLDDEGRAVARAALDDLMAPLATPSGFDLASSLVVAAAS